MLTQFVMCSTMKLVNKTHWGNGLCFEKVMVYSKGEQMISG